MANERKNLDQLVDAAERIGVVGSPSSTGEIVEQLRIFFFGFGLGMGTEFRALSELVGGRSKALDLYQLFRDPQSSFDIASRQYSFMTTGPVSPLSFAGTPLFLNAFNTVEAFLAANRIGK